MGELIQIHLPPIQQRMMDTLRDGLVHNKKEMLACIDECADLNQLYVNMNRLRTILRSRSKFDVVSYNGSGYRLVRLISEL